MSIKRRKVMHFQVTNSYPMGDILKVCSMIIFHQEKMMQVCNNEEYNYLDILREVR